jgi:hypothetical protein
VTPFNALRDVNPIAVSLVKKGANGQRFYLRKEDEGAAVDIGTQADLIVKDDWSTVYCVVASPDVPEGNGTGDKPAVDAPDIWSADEIEKACHRFMKNGALVNGNHLTLDAVGDLVENFIAPDDFTVDTPGGQHTITKGSWCLAVQPVAEFRDGIEKGDITGVSIEGTGFRDLIEKAKGAEGAKAKTCPSCGGTVEANKKTCQNCGYSFATKVKKGSAWSRLVKALSLQRDPEPDPASRIQKAVHTFAERMASNQLDRELPAAFDTLSSVIWSAVYWGEEEGVDPRALISESLAEFEQWALSVYDRASGLRKEQRDELLKAEIGELPEGLAETLGIVVGDPSGDDVKPEDIKKAMSDALGEALPEALKPTTAAIEKLDERLTKLEGGDKADTVTKGGKADPDAPSLATISKSLDGVIDTVADLAEALQKATDGGTVQTGTDDDEAEAIKKAGLDPDFVALFG